MNMTANVSNEMSYCCATLETAEVTQKIRDWIADRQSEGWTVQPTIKEESRRFGVMWQCTSHSDGSYREFTPCINMTGREFRMN